MKSELKQYRKRHLNRPQISVTRLASDQVSIRVEIHDCDAGACGASEMIVYRGSKKIGACRRRAKDAYLFTYKARDAGFARYRVALVAVAGENDKKMSRVVSPRANVWSQRVSTKMRDYEADATGFVIRSIFYKDGNLMVKGYTYNTFGVPVQDYISVGACCAGRTLFDVFEMMMVPAGIRPYTFTIEHAPVRDLRNGNLVVL